MRRDDRHPEARRRRLQKRAHVRADRRKGGADDIELEGNVHGQDAERVEWADEVKPLEAGVHDAADVSDCCH